MWKFALVFVSVLCCVAAKEFIVSSSSISNVKVGGSSAEITRSFSLDAVPEGFHSIIVNDLPKTVDEKSIEVTGIGAAQIISTELQVAKTHRENEQEYNQLVRDLQSILGKISARRGTYTDERTHVVGRKSAIDSYVQDTIHAEKYRNDTLRLTPEKLLDLLNLKQQEAATASALITELDMKVKRLGELSNYVTNTLDNLKYNGYFRNWLSATDYYDIDAAAPADIQASLSELPKGDKFWPASTESRKLVVNIYVPAQADNAGKYAKYISSLSINHTSDDAVPFACLSVRRSQLGLQSGVHGLSRLLASRVRPARGDQNNTAGRHRHHHCFYHYLLYLCHHYLCHYLCHAALSAGGYVRSGHAGHQGGLAQCAAAPVHRAAPATHRLPCAAHSSVYRLQICPCPATLQ